MTTSAGLSQIPATPRPDWLTRNWKWVVPLGLLGLVLVIAGFVATILLIVETSIQHSDCYIQALARARSSPQITQKIGEPVEAGWLASGNINISGPSGTADISIPVSGPRGKGTIYVVAKKSAGEWSFERLEVEVEGQNQRIDLLKPEEIAPRQN